MRTNGGTSLHATNKFTTILKLMEAAKLEDRITSEPHVTLLAPTDDVMNAKVGAQNIAFILANAADPNNSVKHIPLDTIIRGRFDIDTFVNGATLTTMGKTTLTFNRDASGEVYFTYGAGTKQIFIDKPNIVQGSNGVLLAVKVNIFIIINNITAPS